MNQKISLYVLYSVFLCSFMSVRAMDVVNQKLDDYEGIYRIVATSNVTSAELIKNLIREARALDQEINQLPEDQRRTVIPRARAIQLRYQNQFKRAVTRYVSRAFELDAEKIYKIIGATAVSATMYATSSLIYFWLQQKTGNIEQIDQAKLVTAGLEGVVAELVRQGCEQYNARVGNLAANMSKDPIVSIMSAGSAMLVHKKTFIQQPTTTGILWAGLKTELTVVFWDVVDKEGGVTGILRKTNIPKLLFGTSMMPSDQQQLTQSIRPTARTMLVSTQMQQALIEILTVTVDSTLVGILTYYLGLGFAEEPTFPATLSGSAYRGLLEGSFAYIMQRSGGVLQNIASGTLSRAMQNDLIAGAGLSVSQTNMATILIEKSIQTAVQYTLDESGGLGNFTKLLIGKTVRAVNRKWIVPFKDFCLKTVDSMLDSMGICPVST